MVETATMYLLGYEKRGDLAPGVDWKVNKAWTINVVREQMRKALEAVRANLTAPVTVKNLEWFENEHRSIGRAPDGHWWLLDCRDGQWGLLEKGASGFTVGTGSACYFTGPDDAKIGADILNQKRILPNLSATTPSNPNNLDNTQTIAGAARVSPIADLLPEAVERAEKAMRNFPQPNYVISKWAEESGEVTKALIHAAENRESWENVKGEIVDTLAMLHRLFVEGDQVHGLAPLSALAEQ